MLFLIAAVHTLGIDLITSARTRLSTETERGSLTLEQVIVTAALAAIAIGAAAAITAAVTGRLGTIN